MEGARPSSPLLVAECVDVAYEAKTAKCSKALINKETTDK